MPALCSTEPLRRELSTTLPERPFSLTFWDGSELPATNGGGGPALHVRSPAAIAHALRAPVAPLRQVRQHRPRRADDRELRGDEEGVEQHEDCDDAPREQDVSRHGASLSRRRAMTVSISLRARWITSSK